MLVNHFHGNFHYKTSRCRKIKSVFRDVTWASPNPYSAEILVYKPWGLKGFQFKVMINFSVSSSRFILIPKLLIVNSFSVGIDFRI